MSGTVRLETGNLVLRRHVESDASVLYEQIGRNPAMTAYSGWNPYADMETAEQTVGRFLASYGDDRFYGWAIEADGKMAGTIGAYDYDPKSNSIEIGFSIFPSFQRKGYAAAALRKVLRYLKEEEGIGTVTAWCAAENAGSRRVMEKSGMVLKHIEPEGLAIGGMLYDRLDYVYAKGDGSCGNG